MAILFGAVADENAGATDLAGMLADRGMRCLLILSEPWHEDFEKWARDADAVVIGTASHSVTCAAAYEETRRAVRLLKSVDPQVLQVNYRSTFDLTSEVTIGSSIDAAMDETDEQFTVALPVLPVNDTKTYKNDHFVAPLLLSQSSMREHSLNPNSLTHLQNQTKRRVGLASNHDIKQGPAHIRHRLAQLSSDGVEIAVLDCASRDDLQSTCEAVSDMRLVSGSSALAMHLPVSWPGSGPVYPKRRSGGRGFLVVAGSCSPTTRRQNDWLAAHHAVVISLDAMNLCDGTLPDSRLTTICEELASGGTCLLQTSFDRHSDRDSFQIRSAAEVETGQRIARSLAIFVRDVMRLIAPEGLIVAGGETSRMLSRVLGFGALMVGPLIEPGIPVCVTLAASGLPVVLKSGNSGTEGFYGRAIEVIRSLAYQEFEWNRSAESVPSDG